ncbi:hypothetical protein VSK90_14650 [Bacillus swezeyi]|uniref:hypothetical protein n=1 Tax=Bacillus swezeyi TaxID=1925020 RepID=UPI0039C686B1
MKIEMHFLELTRTAQTIHNKSRSARPADAPRISRTLTTTWPKTTRDKGWKG